MFTQYLGLKSDCGGALLFYRMGDFYELFFDDAAIAAAALGIALTRRGQYAGLPVPMCGVPVHAAQAYLARLVAAGHRVAIAEQIEIPGEVRRAGKPMTRAVVRIVTPATLTETELLAARQSNWLAVIAPVGQRVGLAWADVSTGAFYTVDLAADEIASERARIGATETLAPEGYGAIGSTAFEASHFRPATAARRLADYFGVMTLDGLGQFTPAEIAAAGALVAYIAITQRGSTLRLEAPIRIVSDSKMRIDAATRASLDLGRAGLLGAIDRTLTGGGGRLLADDSAAPLTDAASIVARHAAVSWFVENAALRDRTRAHLRGAPDLLRALGRLAAGRAGPRELGQLRDGLACAAELQAVLANKVVPPQIADAAASMEGLETTAGRLTSILGDTISGDLAQGGFVIAGFDPALDRLRDDASGARARIAALEVRYQGQSGISTLRIRHSTLLGYHLDAPARAEAALRAAGYDYRQGLAGAVRFGTPELVALSAEVAQAGEAALAVERAHYEALRADVLQRADQIARAAAAMARIDVSAALADLAVELRWTRPMVDESTAFEVVAGRHPVVEAALGVLHKPYVANGCDMTRERLWLLTGPNMAGKSTFLRQNALIAILAQMGSFVPAQSARIGIVDRLFSRVGASDDLASGRSTFMVEMVEVAAILRQATPRSLVILDEVGRGTSTYDGLAIAWSVLEWMHDRIGCRCLFATHYHELAKLTDRLGSLALKTVRVREWRGELVFLHEVDDGAADKSYGLAVARLAGVPGPVIARARAVLTRLEAGRPLITLANDLPLFAAAPAAEPTAPEPLAARLATLDIDALSPREAHELLRGLVEAASLAAGVGSA